MAVDDDALSIGSARVWIARILGKRRWQVAFGFAEEERVSGVARRTVTDGVVFLHVAVCVEAACTGARILTTLANASKVVLTVSLNGTLWLATLG